MTETVSLRYRLRSYAKTNYHEVQRQRTEVHYQSECVLLLLTNYDGDEHEALAALRSALGCTCRPAASVKAQKRADGGG